MFDDDQSAPARPGGLSRHPRGLRSTPRRGQAGRNPDKAARAQGAYIMFVQADIGEEDAAANALYSKLSVERITANHYDIAP